MQSNKDEVRGRLERFHHTRYLRSNLQYQPRYDILKRMPKAATLAPLFYKGKELHILLTQRSQNLSSHRGEVAFPGGKMDPTDTDEIQTAKREAHEEIGLDPSDVDCIACWHPFIARAGIMVTPVVAFIRDDFIAKPNEEVDHVFSVPLRRFLSSDRMTSRTIEYYGKSAIYLFSDHVDGTTFVTWGLTASMCVYTAMAVFDKKPEFEFHGTKHFENNDMWAGLEMYLHSQLNRMSKV